MWEQVWERWKKHIERTSAFHWKRGLLRAADVHGTVCQKRAKILCWVHRSLAVQDVTESAPQHLKPKRLLKNMHVFPYRRTAA